MSSGVLLYSAPLRTFSQNMMPLFAGVAALAAAGCSPESTPITVDVVVRDAPPKLCVGGF